MTMLCTICGRAAFDPTSKACGSIAEEASTPSPSHARAFWLRKCRPSVADMLAVVSTCTRHTRRARTTARYQTKLDANIRSQKTG